MTNGERERVYTVTDYYDGPRCGIAAPDRLHPAGRRSWDVRSRPFGSSEYAHRERALGTVDAGRREAVVCEPDRRRHRPRQRSSVQVQP